LLALAHRQAFVLSTSVAHPAHLFDGVTAALNFAGPALIRIHAPSPGRHGFADEETVERARLAVESRVNPLLLYDPSAEGVFGRRMSLEGNSGIEQAWADGAGGGPLTPAHWAAGEARFNECFSHPAGGQTVSIDEYLKISSDERGSATPTVPGPNGTSLAVGEILLAAVRERLERWATLQELSGAVTPFTEAIREQLDREQREAHQSELASLKAEYEAKLAEVQRSQTAMQAARLRDRLLQLAGFGAPPSVERKEEEEEEGEQT
jgi:pyruvate-ferredoxin/flavodoxin oxidoreductase